MATITSPRPQSPGGSTRRQSPSLTPASSVRPSLDLSINGRSSSPAPGANVAQRRNRAALRDYYNLKSKAQAQQQNLTRPASIASTTSDSTVTSSATITDALAQTEGSSLTSQLDKPDFDADAYIKNLLQTSNLKTILRAEGTLVSEIRNLDGERKSLVYDNYSKLITATRTIANMQKSMNQASGGSIKSMQTLQPAIDRITMTAQELTRNSSRLHPNAVVTGEDQKRAEESSPNLEIEQRKRDTVRWVLRAPERLEEMLEEGKSTEDMQSEWIMLSPLLEKWKGVKGVEDIRIACQDIMSRSKSRSAGEVVPKKDRA